MVVDENMKKYNEDDVNQFNWRTIMMYNFLTLSKRFGFFHLKSLLYLNGAL